MSKLFHPTLRQLRLVCGAECHIRQLCLLPLDLQKPGLYGIFDDELYGSYRPCLTETVLEVGMVLVISATHGKDGADNAVDGLVLDGGVPEDNWIRAWSM